jgi:hypothetical protein
LWSTLSTGVAASDTYKPDVESKVDEIRSRDDTETLGRRHTVAQLMMNAGFSPSLSPGEYQATCPPGPAISDEFGDLRPFANISQSGNDGLRSLDQWFIRNGMGGTDALSLGELSTRWSDRFDGRKEQGQSRAAGFNE